MPRPLKEQTIIPARPKTTFVYCFQVWISSALIAPIIDFIWNGPSDSSVWSLVGACAFLTFYGLLLSLPSFCMAWLGCLFLFSRRWAIWTKRILLFVLASILTLLPFWLLFRGDDPVTWPADTHLALSFLIPVLLAVGWYRWPETKTRHNSPDCN